MTDLLNQLGLQSRALAAHRVSSAVASHNIDNANTPGYARQSVTLEAALPAEVLGGSFVGRGVAVGSVTQARDRFVEAMVPRALADAARGEALVFRTNNLVTLDPDDQFGLPASLGNFFAAVREMSRSPSDPVARRAAVHAAEELARGLRRSADEVDEARRAADRELAGMADRASSLAAQVAQLNQAIRNSRSQGDPPNDLLDTRQRLVDELASLTGGVPLKVDGDVNVTLGSVALVNGTHAATISTSVDVNNRGHLALVATGTDGSSSVLNARDVGGGMGGVLEARDEALKRVEDGLDSFAFEFAEAANAAHRQGVALDGSTGRDLFTTPAQQAGAARSLAVNDELIDDPLLLGAGLSAAPGDSDALFLLLDTERAAMTSGTTPSESLQTIIGGLSADVQHAQNELEAATAVKDNILGLRDSVSGVSIDEELVEMTKAQRMFDAVSKVITTTDQMLDTLLKLR